MIFPRGYRQFKQQKVAELDWDNFRKGLNTFLRENEIDKDELTEADNLMLTGKGVPTKRWGTQLYFMAGNATGSVRGLKGFYKSDDTNELLAITDDGYLTKRSNASYTQINGASWASGNNVQMAQLNDTMYIVNGQRPLVKYSSPTLVGFATIGRPTVLSATNLSGATGSTTKSYRVSAISAVGETLGSDSFTLSGQPASLGGTAGGTIRLTYTSASHASIAIGFNIYGRDQGYERFIASVPIQANTFDDNGTNIPSEFSFPPTADSTGGPIAKYIIRYQDRLIMAGLDGEPAKVLISGRAPFNERFDLSFGGNFIQIEQDSGDDITGLANFRDRIIVFKQKSIWQIILTTEQIGNFFITTPVLQLITASYGCIAPQSIVAVENDIFFLSREGVNTLGYQSGYAFDVLRTNSISTKIRPFFDNLTTAQKEGAVGAYFKKKYVLAIPGYDKSVVLDQERSAWMGPWTRDARVFDIYTDSNNDEHLLYGNDASVNVDEYSSTFSADSGVAISTSLRTRQEDFNEFELFKQIKELFLQFRNITGSANVNIRLEGRNGITSTAASFSVSSSFGASGWGADGWGGFIWGTTNATVGAGESAQVIKWLKLNRTARTIQVEITTSGKTDNYELLSVKAKATPMGRAALKRSWRD